MPGTDYRIPDVSAIGNREQFSDEWLAQELDRCCAAWADAVRDKGHPMHDAARAAALQETYEKLHAEAILRALAGYVGTVVMEPTAENQHRAYGFANAN